jgi:hypothetical protein
MSPSLLRDGTLSAWAISILQLVARGPRDAVEELIDVVVVLTIIPVRTTNLRDGGSEDRGAFTIITGSQEHVHGVIVHAIDSGVPSLTQKVRSDIVGSQIREDKLTSGLHRNVQGIGTSSNNRGIQLIHDVNSSFTLDLNVQSAAGISTTTKINILAFVKLTSRAQPPKDTEKRDICLQHDFQDNFLKK